MSLVFSIAALCLLLTLVIGLSPLLRNPAGAEGLLAVLLLGTTGVALVLVLGQALAISSSIDVALVFALLSAVLGVVFVLRGWPDPPPPGETR